MKVKKKEIKVLKIIKSPNRKREGKVQVENGNKSPNKKQKVNERIEKEKIRS